MIEVGCGGFNPSIGIRCKEIMQFSVLYHCIQSLVFPGMVDEIFYHCCHDYDYHSFTAQYTMDTSLCWGLEIL